MIKQSRRVESNKNVKAILYWEYYIFSIYERIASIIRFLKCNFFKRQISMMILLPHTCVMKFNSIGLSTMYMNVYIYTHTIQMLLRLVFPGGCDGRVSACNAGDPGLGLPVYMYVYHSSNAT